MNMDRPFIADKEFKGENYTKNRLPLGEYENCLFVNCDFSNGFLDNNIFLECEFEECNLSGANLKHSQFKEVVFRRCKMMGLRFEDCSDFLISFKFVQCSLNFSSFYQLPLRSTVFDDCKLLEVDFTQADLSSASFQKSELQQAVFDQTILVKADFRKAVGFQIDPEQNRLKKAQFSRDTVEGLLFKYDLLIS